MEEGSADVVDDNSAIYATTEVPQPAASDPRWCSLRQAGPSRGGDRQVGREVRRDRHADAGVAGIAPAYRLRLVSLSAAGPPTDQRIGRRF
jgi:hypothetical protein